MRTVPNFSEDDAATKMGSNIASPAACDERRAEAAIFLYGHFQDRTIDSRQPPSDEVFIYENELFGTQLFRYCDSAHDAASK
jgi:hypothetical protein